MTMEEENNIAISAIMHEIKSLLKNFKTVSKETKRNDAERIDIDYSDNPLNPNLLAYCFDIILGFDVKYRIFEKVNYVIEFDYRGTYASVSHFKMDYILSIEKQYKDEIIYSFEKVYPLLENLFLLIGEQALIENKFSMVNEAMEYFSKIEFYENKIETLEKRRKIIEEKLRGKYDIIENDRGYRYIQQKGSDYLRLLSLEITYDIEAYIDTFYSALEHVLTLLYPFTEAFSLEKSYYKYFIRNIGWSWNAKIRDVCGEVMPDEITSELHRIKEVYRNHNTHGGFSREMKAYVQIPSFGRYPMYEGKEYLRGFVEVHSDAVSYVMYLDAKNVFSKFWEILDNEYEIPMLFVRSGLPISVDARVHMEDINNVEQAQWIIDKMWFDICNQSNMDW